MEYNYCYTALFMRRPKIDRPTYVLPGVCRARLLLYLPVLLYFLRLGSRGFSTGGGGGGGGGV